MPHPLFSYATWGVIMFDCDFMALDESVIFNKKLWPQATSDIYDFIIMELEQLDIDHTSHHITSRISR